MLSNPNHQTVDTWVSTAKFPDAGWSIVELEVNQKGFFFAFARHTAYVFPNQLSYEGENMYC